jgi:putative heme-binding domain-containing protein
LRHGEFDRVRRAAPDLLAPRQPQELRLAAVRALGAFPDPVAADLLLSAWRGLTPPVRAEAIETLLRRPAWVAPLLSAIEAGVVHPSGVPVARRNLLLANKDDALRARAERIFGASAPGPRSEVVGRYRETLSLRGRVQEGQAVFRRECATCHRVGSEGHAVGPSLTTVKHRSPEEILTHVLDPNREVSPDGTEYAVTLSDGRVLTGLLAADSEAGLTLRRAQGVEETVPRSQIEEVSGTGRSLMPEGLERTVSPQDMADLIAFLKEGQ